MALYYYQAFSKEGKKVSGYLDAPAIEAVREALGRQGLYPITIALAKEQVQIPWYQKIFARKVTVKEKILFSRQLAVLLKSGVPLLQAIEILVDYFEGQLKSILVAVKDDIKQGTSFADALQKYPKTFDTIYVQLVRAGEASGKLELILDRLTTYLERREAIAKKISGAMFYPMLQLGLAVIVVTILMVFVVPQMIENFKDQELPAPTQLLVSISDFIVNYYLLIIAALIAGIVAFRTWQKTPAGARTIDTVLLRLPVIKYFAKTNAIVQFSYTLGILLEGGVNLAESLDIVVKVISNRILADSLNEARDKIIKQGKIAQYLQQTEIFPPIAIHLISTGEQSGQLDAMLITVAQNYETDLNEIADKLTASITPLLLLVMGFVVGFILISVALPMVEMSQMASKF